MSVFYMIGKMLLGMETFSIVGPECLLHKSKQIDEHCLC